jgi:hypothetical protein
LAPQTPDGAANPCSALRQVSGTETGADFQRLLTASEDGSAAYFIDRGVLTDDEDALGETAQSGDDNLYAWRTDAVHPDGQTEFIGRLELSKEPPLNFSNGLRAESTPDGRYLLLNTSTSLVRTDTDDARDVYRYDADTGELTRLSLNVSGTGGNGDFDAGSHGASDDGEKVIFSTTEPLSALDGNEELDLYLWSSGRVSLLSTGSVGGGVSLGEFGNSGGAGAAISSSGKDIYFSTRQALSPGDGDDALDVYAARIGGGFSFAPNETCSGEACQPSASNPAAPPTPTTAEPSADAGNVKPCPKGKVAKGSKCVKKPHKKPHKKHHKKKGEGHAKRASHNRGGGK